MAERRLRKAISGLNLKTIQFLASDLGQGDAVRDSTWNDCPMTLAQRVGNTLIGKTHYQGRTNVQAFATAWDGFMGTAREYSPVEELHSLTNGFGVKVVHDLAQAELDSRSTSRIEQGKQRFMERMTTDCARETISQEETDQIWAAILGNPPTEKNVLPI